MGTTSETRVKEVLAKFLSREVESIELDHNLRDHLGLDSMGTIELLYDIEDAFDVQIPDEDLKELVTVRDVVDYVERVNV